MKSLSPCLCASMALGLWAGAPSTSRADAKTPPEEIYRLCGYATMSGESPLKLWDRLHDTREWLVGPLSPDIFFALLGKVAGAEQTAELRKLFHDTNKFAGEWILPTISRDDPAYPTQHYWRGKVLAPVNYLVYQGLKINEWDREAHLRPRVT